MTKWIFGDYIHKLIKYFAWNLFDTSFKKAKSLEAFNSLVKSRIKRNAVLEVLTLDKPISNDV